jgi:aryl-alcohol dehydrogenase-like predicted oxidoreductase
MTGMETRPIGTLAASVLGLGCNNFGMRITDPDDAAAVVHAALDAGITYFDTADMYGDGASERMLGAAVAERRHEAVIGTKFGHRSTRGDDGVGASAAFIRRALEGSLERLGVDFVDHYQLHQPDAVTPIAETLTALQELIDEGLVRATGCSNMSAAQIDEMASVAAGEGVTPFATVQNRYSILTRTPENDGVLAACARHGVGFVPYFPLESGLLTGKIRRGSAPPEGTRLDEWSKGDLGSLFLGDDMIDRAEDLIAWAGDHGRTVLEVALAWLAARPTVVTIIAGATSPSQVRTNAAAFARPLTDAELDELDALVAPATES